MNRLAKCASVIALCSALTGCVTVRENVKVDGDGKTATSCDILYRENALSSKNPKKEVLESVKPSLKKGMHAKYITETRKGKKYYGCRITGIKKLPGTSTSVKDHKVTFKMTKVAANNAKSTGSAISPGILEDAGVKMTLSVTMPSKPTTNTGTVKGNTVNVNLLESMNSAGKLRKPIVITSDDGKTVIPVWLAAVLIAGIAGAGIYYFAKNRKE